MNWTVKISKTIQKQIEKLPPSPRKRLNFLVAEIEKYGPVRDSWPNYRRIRGKKDCYHCHFKKGNPTYVAVWKVTKNEIKGSVKNNLVEFAPKFAVDLIDLIEQNRRNSELFRGFFANEDRLKIW